MPFANIGVAVNFNETPEGWTANVQRTFNVGSGLFNVDDDDVAAGGSYGTNALPSAHANIDFSVGNFSFQPFPSTAGSISSSSAATSLNPSQQPALLAARTFTPPEPVTEPGTQNVRGFAGESADLELSGEFDGGGNAAEAKALFSNADTAQPAQRVFRPNGVHTRIFPLWTPGLYQ